MNKYQMSLLAIKEALEYVNLSPFVKTSQFKCLQDLVNKYDSVCEILKKKTFEDEQEAKIINDFLEG